MGRILETFPKGCRAMGSGGGSSPVRSRGL